jgi:hypothetical protein
LIITKYVPADANLESLISKESISEKDDEENLEKIDFKNIQDNKEQVKED